MTEMRMRTHIYIIFLLSLLSCSKDIASYIPDSDNMIRFSGPSVILGTAEDTRAMVNASSLPLESTFGVWGYCKALKPGATSASDVDNLSTSSYWDVKKALCTPTVFTSNVDYNMLEVSVGENNICSYTDGTTQGAIQWIDESSYYSFLGIYPAEKVGEDKDIKVTFLEHNGIEVNSPKITYTHPLGGEPKDSLKSNTIISDYSSIPDLMIGWHKDHRKADGHVRLQFHHMISALSVCINNYSERHDSDGNPAGSDLTIYSVKLVGSFHKKLEVDMAKSGEYSFLDSYYATYVLYDGGDSGFTVPYIDQDKNDDVDPTSIELDNPLMLLCGKPGEDHPYGPNSLGQKYDLIDGQRNYDAYGYPIKLIVDYKFGENSRTTKRLPLINPDLSFIPRVGVNYTFHLNWIGEGQILLVMPSSDVQWGDGEADDNELDNDDVVFE